MNGGGTGNVDHVTAVRPGLASAAVLDDTSLPALTRLLDADPYVNVVIGARLRTVRTLVPGRLGGTMLGIADGGGEIAAACFNGGNLLPIGGDPEAWEVLARQVAERARVCSSIVGRHDAVEVVWERLTKSWGAARSIRSSQPLLVLNGSVPVLGDDSVRPATGEHFERYVAAASAMFTEELGVSPHISPGSAAFRSRIADLLKQGRAFASFDFRGQVVFKAEIGAVSAHTAQIQGVWVRPDLRGHGIGTSGLASVLAHARTLAPTASLYVNDFNEAALRMYERLGMRQVATLATILLT
jgi:predicted GNAT family acetyltransferase